MSAQEQYKGVLTRPQEHRGAINGIHVNEKEAYDDMGNPVDKAQAALARTRRQMRRTQITRNGDTTFMLGETEFRTSR